MIFGYAFSFHISPHSSNNGNMLYVVERIMHLLNTCYKSAVATTGQGNTIFFLLLLINAVIMMAYLLVNIICFQNI